MSSTSQTTGSKRAGGPICDDGSPTLRMWQSRRIDAVRSDPALCEVAETTIETAARASEAHNVELCVEVDVEERTVKTTSKPASRPSTSSNPFPVESPPVIAVPVAANLAAAEAATTTSTAASAPPPPAKRGLAAFGFVREAARASSSGHVHGPGCGHEVPPPAQLAPPTPKLPLLPKDPKKRVKGLQYCTRDGRVGKWDGSRFRNGCQHPDGCSKGAVGSTDCCSAHGGGRRCQHPDGCSKSARGNTGYCSAHGGGRRCQHPDGCSKSAVDATNLCKAHGGGKRCATGVHLEDVPPHARYTLSESAVSYGADGKAYARPEWVGTRCCMECLKQLDPDNTSVKIYIRKEHLVVSEIASELFRRGLGHLVRRATGIITHDCVTGSSQRRADLDIDVGPRLFLEFENDEFQHVDRQLSCERRKLAAHLVDKGVVGLTKAEAALWDPPHPDDLDLEKLKGTSGDTPAMQQLRRDRAAATTRLMREYAAKRREAIKGQGSSSSDAASSVVISPKLHCLRFNCDNYVTADGARIGGLFATTGVQSQKYALKLQPTKAFAGAIHRLVDRILELRELAEDDAWIEAHPEWDTEYMRYDGCNRRGYDPEGVVAMAHAARRVEDEEGGNGMVMDTDGEESEEDEDSDDESELSSDGDSD